MVKSRAHVGPLHRDEASQRVVVTIGTAVQSWSLRNSRVTGTSPSVATGRRKNRELQFSLGPCANQECRTGTRPRVRTDQLQFKSAVGTSQESMLVLISSNSPTQVPPSAAQFTGAAAARSPAAQEADETLGRKEAASDYVLAERGTAQLASGERRGAGVGFGSPRSNCGRAGGRRPAVPSLQREARGRAVG